MLLYIYDGSFEGLLTCIYEAYYRHDSPDRILSSVYLQENLLDTYTIIATDTSKYEKVYEAIKKKISDEALLNAYYVYLSDYEDAGSHIYKYLKLGWKVGKKVDLYLADHRVLDVIKLARKVAGENHRMLGLVRFKLIGNGIYYAAIEPQHNIVTLAAPHFANRMADQNWIIHDVKRSVAAFYNQSDWFLTEMRANQNVTSGQTEVQYQELWKQYFKSISIEERVNPGLQKQHMPMKYWKYLIEKNPSPSQP